MTVSYSSLTSIVEYLPMLGQDDDNGDGWAVFPGVRPAALAALDFYEEIGAPAPRLIVMNGGIVFEWGSPDANHNVTNLETITLIEGKIVNRKMRLDYKNAERK